MADGDEGRPRAGDADGPPSRPRLCGGGRDAVALSRRCEEICARFEGCLRAAKEDVDGCLRRQHDVHTQFSAMKAHVAMLDTLTQRLDGATSSLTKAVEAAVAGCLKLEQKVAALEEQLAALANAALPPEN